MTYEEYKRSNGLVGIGSVKLEPSECEHISDLSGGRKLVSLRWSESSLFSYLLFPHSTTLYTMDDDGNKRASTVFSLDIPLDFCK